MEIEEKIQYWLGFELFSRERFGLLRAIGETWENVIKERSKIPISFIDMIILSNFSESTIKKYGNGINTFKVQNIGVNFHAFEKKFDDDNDEYDLPYKIGRCRCSIIVEISSSDPPLKAKSITPIEFTWDPLPEWEDRGEFFYIRDWLNYWMKYDDNLLISISKWFNISLKDAKEWIEKQIVPKSFEENKKVYDKKYNHNNNIAEKMFDSFIGVN